MRERKLIINPDEAQTVRRVFELFLATRSGTEAARVLQQEGRTSKTGRLLDKGDVYKLLANRTYVQVLLSIRRRPGRKTVVTPEGASTAAPSSAILTSVDPALVKALDRAFRYQRMLDEGRYVSITEVADAERLDRGYMGRLLQLTLLAPDLVSTILDGGTAAIGLASLFGTLPADWLEQQIQLLD